MFQNHLLLLVLFSACVAVVSGVLMRDDRRGQLRAALTVFASFVGAAIAAGWLLYVFPI